MSFWDLVDKAGRKVFGRSNAGTVSIVARCMRIGAAVAATGIVIGSIVATGGFALPIWAVGGLIATMVVNGAAIPFSWAGNHMKVLQYEDAQTEALADVNQLQNTLAKTAQGPDVKLSEKIMIASRKFSDVNGVAGSVLSIVSGAATVGLYTPAAPIAAAIMLASRASGVLSAGINVPITRSRISIQKNKLSEIHSSYRELSALATPTEAARAHGIVEGIFTKLNISKEGHLNEWLSHYLYKAVYSHPLLQNPNLTAENIKAISTSLEGIVTPLLAANAAGVREVSKDKLKNIDSTYDFSKKEGWLFRKLFNKGGLASLDAMQVLVKKSQDAISATLHPTSHAESIATADKVVAGLGLDPKEASTKQLKHQIRASLIEVYSCVMKDSYTDAEKPSLGTLGVGLVDAVTGILKPYVKTEDGATVLDTDKIAKIGLPTEAHSAVHRNSCSHGGHGNEFLPHHHLGLLGDKIKEGMLQYSSPDITHKKVTAPNEIADLVVSKLKLNPDNFYTQQFHRSLVLSCQSGLPEGVSVAQQAQIFADEARKHIKPETTRPVRNFFRTTETGYCVFDKDSIIAKSTATPDQKKEKDFKYSAFSEMMGKTFSDAKAQAHQVEVAMAAAVPVLPVQEPRDFLDELFGTPTTSRKTDELWTPTSPRSPIASGRRTPVSSFVEFVATQPQRKGAYAASSLL